MSGFEGNGKPYPEQTGLHHNLHTPYRAALLTQPANFRQAIADAKADPKKTLLGVAHGIPSTFVTKLLASAHPDFIWLDLEHAMFNRLEVFDAIHAVQHHSEGRSMAIVRVTKGDPTTLASVLDAGASGIVIPHVESAEEVREAMKEVFYPPLGSRSFSPWTFTPNISDQSLYPDDSFNIDTANNHVVLIPQIESVKGIENIDEIASVPGIGGIMFGFGDFSLDAGIRPKMGGVPDPKILDAMGKLTAAAKKNDLAMFGAAMVPEMVPGLVATGFSVIAVFFDYWGLVRATADNLKQSREALLAMSAAPAATNGDAKADEKDVVVPPAKAE